MYVRRGGKSGWGGGRGAQLCLERLHAPLVRQFFVLLGCKKLLASELLIIRLSLLRLLLLQLKLNTSLELQGLRFSLPPGFFQFLEETAIYLSLEVLLLGRGKPGRRRVDRVSDSAKICLGLKSSASVPDDLCHVRNGLRQLDDSTDNRSHRCSDGSVLRAGWSEQAS